MAGNSSIWPTIEEEEFSESENEDEAKIKKSCVSQLDNKPSVTEDEINGDFPILKLKGDYDESSSDEEDKEETITKRKNPYLTTSADSLQLKYNEKLRNLHMKRNEARKMNHKEVAAEDQRKKLPTNYESMRKRAEWELEDKNARERAEEEGEDYDRVKLLGETAEDVEILERRKRKKKNMDPGFSDFAAAQKRQYDRLTTQIKPDLQSYEQSKKKLGEDAFPSAHNLMYGTQGKCSEEAIDRMVNDLEKQIDKRAKFHRRRQHHDEADIDYINEKNMKFNQKAERYYGQYTTEIKQNLERGTAI